jgi:hypothetical protein
LRPTGTSDSTGDEKYDRLGFFWFVDVCCH